MFCVLATERVKTGSIGSRLTFKVDVGAVGIGQRYLAVDGKRFYNLESIAKLVQLSSSDYRMQTSPRRLAKPLKPFGTTYNRSMTTSLPK